MSQGKSWNQLNERSANHLSTNKERMIRSRPDYPAVGEYLIESPCVILRSDASIGSYETQLQLLNELKLHGRVLIINHGEALLVKDLLKGTA